MRKNFTLRKIRTLLSVVLGFTFLMAFPAVSDAQVRVPFTQRTSQYTPAQTIYNIKGDFTMIGNTNLTLQNYADNLGNENNMVYVDVDGVSNTFNSSSATLGFSTENGAIPECSNIIYAGLYWTGRAHDGTSPNTFEVTKDVPGTIPQAINNDLVISTTNSIQYTNYQLTVIRSGVSNNRTLTYRFSPQNALGDIVEFIYAHNNGNQTLQVSINGGPVTSVSTSSIDADNAYLSTPYVIYSESGGITLTVNRLYRDGRNSTAQSARAFVNVSGTYFPLVSLTKPLDKSVVYLKHESASGYTQINATDVNFTRNIYYPTNTDGYMYSAYAEVTDYVRQNGIGEYFVADIALREGNGGGTGFFGGWGLIVVYENSLMKYRNITIFDGHAYVVGSTTTSQEIPVSGFQTVPDGDVIMKLGLMAGEGDRGISGDYFQIRNYSDNQWINLTHGGNTTNNFFNSSIFIENTERNPNLVNNTGLDISMFEIPNANNSIITNDQTSTTFRYGTTQDTYIIFCMAMAVEAYTPEPLASNEVITVNDQPYIPGNPVLPGDEIEYTLEVLNYGTEAINDFLITIPIPYTIDFVSSSAVFFYTEGFNGEQPYFDPLEGATGSIIWNIGYLPLPDEPEDVLAVLTYRFRVTEDCFILSNPQCDPAVTVDGGFSGFGDINNNTFSGSGFIQGFETDGVCAGQPIYDPVSILIDREEYIAENCNDQDYSTRVFTYCNVTGTTIPFTDVNGFFPIGSRFYNEYPVGSGTIEYTNATGFPATTGNLTYYAIPPGITDCYWPFTIVITTISSTPSVSDVFYCEGDLAEPLTATPSSPEYPLLFYYTTLSSELPTYSITPLTTPPGTTSYYVAEGISAQCISPSRATINVTVYENPECLITGPASPVCPGAALQFSATEGMDEYAWIVTGNASISGSNTQQTVNILVGDDCELPFTIELTVTNGNDCDSSCQLEVLVEDVSAPVFTTIPADLTVECDGSGNTTQLNNWLANVAASDGCGNVSITHDFTALSNDCGATGSALVTWTAEDDCGNTTATSASFTIVDTTAPVIDDTLLADLTLECDGTTDP
ncbi:MAG: hypothetical protein GX168_10625, partial [Bacteroidales bacterium]|nr:hypothetical protein [Bacteroidales bacterium]